MTPFARISVIVPCFNAARFIPETLRSVLAQQGVEIEVIEIDDGSTDGSADVVANSFPEVKLLRQENQGVAAARNLGLRHASHDWVAFIDADDIWLPGKLAGQWAHLQSNLSASVSYTAWQVWKSSEVAPTVAFMEILQATAGDKEKWKGASGWLYPELLVDCVVWTSTVVARRSLLVDLGGFDRDLRIGEDWDLWLRASRRTPILRLARPYALYRLHSGNVTKTAPRTNPKAAVINSALHRWGYESPDGRRARRADVNSGLARSWADFAGAHLIAGNLHIARESALQAVRTDPAQLLGWTVLAKTVLRALTQRMASSR